MKKNNKQIIILVSILLFIITACFIFFLTKNYGETFDAQTLPLLYEMDSVPLFTQDLLTVSIKEKIDIKEAAKKTSGKNVYLSLYKDKVQDLLGDEEYGSWSPKPDTRLYEQYKSIDAANELMFSAQVSVKNPKLWKYTQEQLDMDVKSIDAALVYTKYVSHSLFRKAWCRKYGLMYYLGCGKSSYEKNPKSALSPIPQQSLEEIHNLTKDFLDKK